MEHPVKEIRNVVRALTQGTPQEQRDAIYQYYAPDASFVHPFCRVPSFENVQIPGIGEVNSRAIVQAIFSWYKILSPQIDLDIESVVFDQRANILYLRISQVFSIRLIPFYRAPVQLVTVLHLVPSTQKSPTINGITSGNQTNDSKDDDDQQEESSPRIDAAKEKLQSVLEGEAPSYAAVTANEASTENSSASSPTRKDGNAKEAGDGRKAVANGGTKKQGQSSRSRSAEKGSVTKYYIQRQEDLYQVNEWLKFLTMSPGAILYGAWQLFATLICVLGALAAGPLMRVGRPNKA